MLHNDYKPEGALPQRKTPSARAGSLALPAHRKPGWKNDWVTSVKAICNGCARLKPVS